MIARDLRLSAKTPRSEDELMFKHISSALKRFLMDKLGKNEVCPLKGGLLRTNSMVVAGDDDTESVPGWRLDRLDDHRFSV